jgi:hypothetical protein
MIDRAEWRTASSGDTLLLVDATSRVIAARTADTGSLSTFLTTNGNFESLTGTLVIWSESPEDWGDEVMSRAGTGEVLAVDPELFWDRIHRWYRSRGVDFDSETELNIDHERSTS